jgi:hypothetical protein
MMCQVVRLFCRPLPVFTGLSLSLLFDWAAVVYVAGTAAGVPGGRGSSRATMFTTTLRSPSYGREIVAEPPGYLPQSLHCSTYDCRELLDVV